MKWPLINTAYCQISKTHSYMHAAGPPSALQVATYAVTLLENDPLFNAGKGAVFTRDGIQQLEASVMVSRGHAKRAAGVLGLRNVKNPSKYRGYTMMNLLGRQTCRIRVCFTACSEALRWVKTLRGHLITYLTALPRATPLQCSHF
jgi:hypothetical protein